MWNPFKPNEEKKVREAAQEQTNYELAGNIVSNPHAIIDEQNKIDRREILLQLSQWQQDRTPAMQKIFYKLSGYYYDEKAKVMKVETWNSSYCNIMGARKMVDFIETLDHNVMLANWGEKTLIITLRDAVAHPLRRFIFNNHNELGITMNHAEYVFWMIINNVEPTYWRGWNDGERRKDREIIKVNELRNPYYQQKKKGIFGMEA